MLHTRLHIVLILSGQAGEDWVSAWKALLFRKINFVFRRKEVGSSDISTSLYSIGVEL